MSVSLQLLLLLLVALHRGAEAKYASGARRSGRRLVSNGTSPLEQHRVSTVSHCLNLCHRLQQCAALNFGAVSATANCELFGQRACHGLTLVADAAVDYYDVYDAPENLAAETKTPFWDEASCVQDGYCAPDCAAGAASQFCLTEDHCSVGLQPPGGYRCVDATCQPSSDFWELRAGLALPRWQLWRLDWHAWTFKQLKPGTCSLDINIKLSDGAEVYLVPEWTDQHIGTRIVFRINTLDTDLYYHDKTGRINWLNMDVSTPGMVRTDAFSRLKVSWCGGIMTIGPEDNPTLGTARANITQPIGYVMARSSGAPSWMYVDSGVADRWLFEDSGVSEDSIMDIGPDTYVFRNTTPTKDVTVKYDCLSEKDCAVLLQESSPAKRILVICVGCETNDEVALTYYGDILLILKQIYSKITQNYTQNKATGSLYVTTIGLFSNTHLLVLAIQWSTSIGASITSIS